ncbi:MAG: T9SS type A sorting domain-containing protein [Flavobacteriales bacterium]|nr:T9SS type A sorting domain-containing protein [Flavobacteriales bacterium]
MQKLAAFVLLLCHLVPIAILGQSPFAEPVLLTPLISEVREPILVDLNGDGSLEVILGSTGAGRVISIPVDGASEERQVVLEGEVPRELFAMGDVDGDGLPDLITGRVSPEFFFESRCIALYRNLGGGSIAAPLTIAMGTTYTAVQVGDINGDGRAEILARRSQGVDVFRFEDGELVQLHTLNGSWSGIHLADLSNDGVLDLVLHRSIQPSSIAFWNAVTHSSGQPVQIVPSLTSGEVVVASDLNGDGLLDLHSDRASGGALPLWLGEGEGAMGPLMWLDFGTHINGLHVRNVPGIPGSEIWAHGYGVVYRFLVDTDLTVLSIDTIITLDDHVRSWTFGPEGVEEVLDIFVITEDDQLHRLRYDTGLSTLLANETLFGWNHALTGGMLARDNANGERSLHMLSNGTSSRTHLMTIDPFQVGELNVPKRLRLPNANWTSTLGDHGTLSTSLIELDLNNDGEPELFGHLNDWRTSFPICRFFAITDPDNVPQFQCLNNDILGSFDIDVIRGWSFLDFNNDGWDDIVVKGSSQRVTGPVMQESFIRRLDRTTDPMFNLMPNSSMDREFAIHHDLDGDGLDDLLVLPTAYPPDWITIKKNNGDASFTSVNTIPYHFELGWIENNWGMVDPDGAVSLLRFSNLDGNVVHHQRVLHDDLAPPVHFFTGTVRPILHDMNGDGLLDVLHAEPTGQNTMALTLYINEGDFPLLNGTIIHEGPERQVTPIDVDGDGMADIVLTKGPALHWLRNLTIAAEQHPTTSGTFNVFPNPAEGAITVDLGVEPGKAIRLDVCDSSGRIVRAYSSTIGINTLDVRTLANGLYVLRAFAEEEGTSLGIARIVVQHAP